MIRERLSPKEEVYFRFISDIKFNNSPGASITVHLYDYDFFEHDEKHDINGSDVFQLCG